MPKKKTEINRVQIISAVYQLMEECGYQQITVDMIAERAGISKRTLYAYYPSKDALFATIYEDYLRGLYDELLGIEKSEHRNEEIVCEILTAFNDFTVKHRKYHIILWMFACPELGFDIPNEIAHHIAVWNSSVYALVMRVLEAKIVSGFFKTVPVETLAQMISTMNKGISLQIGRSEELVGYKLPKAETLLKTYCEMIRAVGAEGEGS